MTICYDYYFWKNSKIHVRPATPEDWEYHYPNCFDSEARFLLNEVLELPPDPVKDREEWEEYVRSGEKNNCLVFTVEAAAGGVVGSFNFNSVNERSGSFSVGIQMDPGHRGKGYGAAAMRMIGRYAFLERRMHRWDSAYVDGNMASAAMHLSLGFVREGLTRECLYHEGRHWNMVRCGLLREEFLSIPSNLED